MKKIYFLTTIAVIALSVSSCQKFLDKPAVNKYDSQNIFETVDRAEMVVVGCYSQTFNREMYYQLGMGTDECMSTESASNSKNQVGNYVYTASIAPTSTFTAMYAGIEYANVAIKGLQGMTVSDAERPKWNMLLGEAYAIRAMNYLNVVRYFGDAPYSTEPVGETGQFSSSRVSRDVIYDGCVKDLQTAVNLLPWKSAGMVPTPERFTKNAALGMLARVALYAAGYSLRWDLKTYSPASCQIAQRPDAARIKELYKIAADACQQVMTQNENALLPAFETVFRNLITGKYDNECMLLFGQWGATNNGAAVGYTNGIYAHASCMYTKSQPAMAVTPTYWYDFAPGDLRRDVTICNYGIDADNSRKMNSYTSNTIGKFRVSWSSGTGTAVDKRDIDWPVLRYSDVLLMYAEALNEYNNGPTTEAKAAFEKVRTRGFGGDASKIGVTPTDYTGFRNAIILERKLEFGFESLRRTDLERWGILYETLTQTKQNLNDMANVTGAYANIDRYRVYKLDTARTFQDPVVSVPYTGYNVLSPSDSTSLANAGNIVLRMHGVSPLSSQGTLEANNALIQNLFRGLERAKVEILPLATTIIDVNPGLKGQQQPKY